MVVDLKESTVAFLFLDEDHYRSAMSVFEETWHNDTIAPQPAPRSSAGPRNWAYLSCTEGMLCCIIGGCPIACLRSRICVTGSPLPLRFLSTSWTRNDRRIQSQRRQSAGPQSQEITTPATGSICISASIEAPSQRCFPNSHELRHIAFEHRTVMPRFGFKNFWQTPSLSLEAFLPRLTN
jgi:hypothetical protein